MSTQDALKELGVTSGTTSECLPTDEVCKKKEDAAAAKAALEAAENEQTAYQPEEYVAFTTDTGLECSMDGFVKMIKEITEVALLGLSLFKETVTAMAP